MDLGSRVVCDMATSCFAHADGRRRRDGAAAAADDESEGGEGQRDADGDDERRPVAGHLGRTALRGEGPRGRRARYAGQHWVAEGEPELLRGGQERRCESLLAVNAAPSSTLAANATSVRVEPQP
jgi:hypothetical protein